MVFLMVGAVFVSGLKQETFDIRPGVEGSVTMGEDEEGDAWLCKFEWKGVSGGTGEKWEISMDGKKKRASIGREGGNDSYLLFQGVTLVCTAELKDVSLFDAEGREYLRGTDYEVEVVPNDISTVKFDVGKGGKKKTLVGIQFDGV